MLGSPPQVRGKLLSATVDAGNNGITPAGAGKTGDNPTMPPVPKDHPRRCGENCLALFNGTHDSGSPPQVRGKQVWKKIVAVLLRITPAGAGKTGS